MKRIKAACICQTLLFAAKDNTKRNCAAQLAQEEFEQYKISLQHTHTQYRIVKETPRDDGSILVEVIKQYNQSPVRDYLK